MVLLLVMPVVQMLLLSYAANYEIKNLARAVVDHDHSPTSRQRAAKLGASGYLHINQFPTAAIYTCEQHAGVGAGLEQNKPGGLFCRFYAAGAVERSWF